MILEAWLGVNSRCIVTIISQHPSQHINSQPTNNLLIHVLQERETYTTVLIGKGTHKSFLRLIKLSIVCSISSIVEICLTDVILSIEKCSYSSPT